MGERCLAYIRIDRSVNRPLSAKLHLLKAKALERVVSLLFHYGVGSRQQFAS